MKGILPLTPKQLATRAVCCVCGEPMVAQSTREQALMNRHPRDGQWLCESCRDARIAERKTRR